MFLNNAHGILVEANNMSIFVVTCEGYMHYARKSTPITTFEPSTFCVQDEFLDVIYWMRQIMSIFIGLIWGIIPLQGYVGILL